MDDTLYGLSAEDVERLRKLLAAYETGELKVGQPQDLVPIVNVGESVPTYVGITQEEIEAVFDTAPGTGDVKITALVPPDLTEKDFIVEACNFSSSPIASGSYVALIRDPYSGKYFITTGGGGFPKVIEGTLDEALTVGGSADVTVWDAFGDDTEETITVEDKAGWAAPIGTYVMAIQISALHSYRPIVIGCVS